MSDEIYKHVRESLYPHIYVPKHADPEDLMRWFNDKCEGLAVSDYGHLPLDQPSIFEIAATRARNHLVGAYLLFLARFEDDPLITWIR